MRQGETRIFNVHGRRRARDTEKMRIMEKYENNGDANYFLWIHFLIFYEGGTRGEAGRPCKIFLRIRDEEI